MSKLPAKNEPNPAGDHRLVPALAASETLVSEAFGRWLDAELTKLEARWIHLAAPNASRPRRSFLRRRSQP